MPTSAPDARPTRRAFRCAAGCLHLQWDRLILNFTAEEFAQLHALIERAAAAPPPPAPAESARDELAAPGAGDWRH